jgi:hypothetical protein
VSTPAGLLPDMATEMLADGGLQIVQLMKVDEHGEVLATSWMVQGEYTDLRGQLAALFGQPFTDLTMDGGAMLPMAVEAMQAPGTHIAFGGPP